MTDEEFEDDVEFDDEDLPLSKQQIDERARHIRDQIELRKIARELGLSLEDYIEAFGK